MGQALKNLITFLLITLTINAFSQNQEHLPPFKKFPFFPPVKLLKPDGKTYFTKSDLSSKKPVLLMLFDPHCDHCQHETEEIIRHIDDFKKVQIVMATSAPFDTMMAFRHKYQLHKYPNIITGQDSHYFLSSFFMIRSLPYLAFFNRKKELISVFEGSLPIQKVIAELKK